MILCWLYNIYIFMYSFIYLFIYLFIYIYRDMHRFCNMLLIIMIIMIVSLYFFDALRMLGRFWVLVVVFVSAA